MTFPEQHTLEQIKKLSLNDLHIAIKKTENRMFTISNQDEPPLYDFELYSLHLQCMRLRIRLEELMGGDTMQFQPSLSPSCHRDVVG